MEGEADTVQDLVVVGAGPHALTFLCFLLEQEPMGAALVDAHRAVIRSRLSDRELRAIIDRRRRAGASTRGSARPKLKVVDRHGGEGWMRNWRRQFDVLRIENLRSNAGLHPDPVDPEMLFEYARALGLSMEEGFAPITGVPRSREFHGPFQVPTAALFARFCDFLVQAYRLGGALVEGEVVAIEQVELREGGGEDGGDGVCNGFCVTLANGTILKSRIVVASVGHANLRNFPDWIDPDSAPAGRISHAWDFVHIEGVEKQRYGGEVILIIGGGQTSVQLAALAVDLGAKMVVLLVRSELKVRQFDSDLLWTGRLRSERLRAFFKEAHMDARLGMIEEARQGGTITPEGKATLECLEAQGRCRVMEGVEGWDAQWVPEKGSFDVLLSDDTEMVADRIWAATGSRMDVVEEGIFDPMMTSSPISTVGGYPVLQPDLRWNPGVNMYVIGAYSALAVGPDAVNLSGARRAGFKVAKSIKECWSRTPQQHELCT
eukprot:evm.model.scf_1685.2 EVM.evm.TU.scf_1685.2   scf_1685:9435-10904(-)